MPAETHSHSDAVTADAVLDLLATIVHDDGRLDPATPLADIGLDDELALIAFWDAAAEEYSERGLGEPDLEQLAECRTVLELAESTARLLGPGATPPDDASAEVTAT